MPRKNQSEINEVKNAVLNNIRRMGCSVESCSRLGKSIYVLDNGAIIDLIYAGLNSRQEFFFGIEEEQFCKVYQETRNYFQLFVCEHSERVFIVPLSFMMEILRNAKANDHITFHQWKPIIRKRNGEFILRCNGIYEMTDYLNRYDYLLQDENDRMSSIVIPPVKFNTEIEVKSEQQKIKEVAVDYQLEKNDVHSTTIFMLEKLGKWFGYKVLTESTPIGLPGFPYQIDCLWYKDDDLFLAIEVCNKGSIEKDKDALKQAKFFGARKVIIVTDVSKLERIRKLYMYNGEIKSWTEVWSFNRVFNMFDNAQKLFKDFTKFKHYQWNDNIMEYV